MTHPATSPARRAPRSLAAVRAFAFACALLAAPAAFSEDLAICPECGRESDLAASFCSSCGAALRAGQGTAAQDATSPGDAAAASGTAAAAADGAQLRRSEPEAVSAAKAAARDVAEARRRGSAGDVAAAFALFRNAQALLASGAGPALSANAARTLADEAEAARLEFCGKFPASRRQAAAAAGMRAAETYFRGEGRVRLGGAWVPSGWVTSLPPPSLAAIRLSVPPFCAACSGAGFIPCRTCAGTGSVPCKAKGCVGGRVERKPVNSLTPKSDFSIREKCPVCGGTARVACGTCAGRGRDPCRKCGGTGDAPVCKGCAGTGLQDCRQCLKKGIDPECPLCAGTGKVLCGKCGGDGRIGN